MHCYFGTYLFEYQLFMMRCLLRFAAGITFISLVHSDLSATPLLLLQRLGGIGIGASPVLEASDGNCQRHDHCKCKYECPG